MSTLYEIDSWLGKLLAYVDHLAENGQDDVELEKLIKEAEQSRADKIENVGRYIKQLDAEAEQWKAEEARIAKERKAKEARSASLKAYLGSIMGKEKYSSPSVNISGHLDVSAVYTAKVSEVPEEFIREVTRKEVNKPAVNEALKNGEVLSFAHLVEKKRVK